MELLSLFLPMTFSEWLQLITDVEIKEISDIFLILRRKRHKYSQGLAKVYGKFTLDIRRVK